MGRRKKTSRVTLDGELTARLDRLIAQVKKASGKKLPRSQVVAALIEALLERRIEAATIHSADDLKAAVLGVDPHVVETLLDERKPRDEALDEATLEALRNAIK